MMRCNYIIFILFLLFLNSCLNYKSVKISSHNMEPTYNIGDVVIIDANNKINFNNNDIIAYYMPVEFQHNGLLNDKKAVVIVRIIGSMGDKLFIRDDKLFLNEKLIDDAFSDYEEFIQNQMFINKVIENKYVIKENEYFIMGDNKNNSNDSRFFGPISKDIIIGKVIVK